MKKLVFIAMVGLTLSANAKIWIVDSNPGSTAKDFTTLNAAYTGAVAGDTLYLIGSPVNYLTARLDITKRLVIIGPGYFLNENPDTQVVPIPATLFVAGCSDAIAFSAGSEGSIMMGIQVNGRIVVSANNIAIRRNFINHMLGVGGACSTENILISGSNCLIQQNFIAGPSSLGVRVVAGVANVTISNNFISYFCAHCGDPNITCLATTGATVVVANNVLYGAIQVSNSVVENNVFPIGSTVTAVTSVVRNNIHSGSGLPAGNGNQNNQGLTTVFVATGSTDGYWTLKAGSPGLGAGFGGVDCGMFGGPEPYVLSGIPPIPSIYSLTAPSVGEKNTGLPVQIKIKSNN